MHAFSRSSTSSAGRGICPESLRIKALGTRATFGQQGFIGCWHKATPASRCGERAALRAQGYCRVHQPPTTATDGLIVRCQLQGIVEHGRAAWQEAFGYPKRARAEAVIRAFKQAIGDELRSRTDQCRATEVDVAAHALNRMLELGRPICVRTA